MPLAPCPGDTRGDGRCDKDASHRVCAALDPSFFAHTRQRDWCAQTRDAAHCTWCICKWALDDWVRGVGCDRVSLRCDATDVCNVKASSNVPDARACVRQQCPTQWAECPSSHQP